MRNYLVFGSNDKVSWAMLNTVAAGGSQGALNQARAQEDYKHYAAVPERNWASATPDVVERPPVVKWQAISPDQLSVDDVLDEKQEKIEEARAAIDDGGAPASGTASASSTTRGQVENDAPVD